MNNCQLNQNNPKDNRCASVNADTTYCTPVYGQIVSSRENHNQINDIQQKMLNEMKPSSSFRKDWNTVHGKTTEGWDEFSKRNISIKGEKKKTKTEKKVSNGKSHYDFFPYFDNKMNDAEDTDQDVTNDVKDDNSKIIIEPMQKIVLQSTEKDICDSKTSTLSPVGS